MLLKNKSDVFLKRARKQSYNFDEKHKLFSTNLAKLRKEASIPKRINTGKTKLIQNLVY